MKKRSTDEFNSLNQFLESVKSWTLELIFGAGDALYHYTDLGGLQGIIQNDDLWLTHSRYSNDDEEITHGYRMVREVIEEERNRRLVASNRKRYLNNLYELVKEPSAEGVYICCFCLDDNLLSQWRGYGANGTGVSLRFDPNQFSYITGPDSPHNSLMRLWKVFYEEEKQKNIIRKAIDFAFSKKGTLDQRARQAADAIQFFIPTFKNNGFSEERECRLIFTPAPDFKKPPRFRVSRGMLVPYYTLRELSDQPGQTPRKLPLTGIRIGPSSNRNLNLASAQMIRDQAGYASVNIDTSSTPYRG